MILHLPIGLIGGLIALEIVALFRRKPVAREVLLLLCWLVALSGVAAAVSGFVLSYEGDFSGPTLDRHLQLGIAFAIVTLLSALLLSRGAMGAYRGLLLFAACLMVPVGHLGASMTHGEDFLTAPFAGSARSERKGGEPISEGTLIDATSNSPAGDDFAQVSGFLEKYCIECHGPERAKGRLRVDSAAGLRKGGKSGPSIVPGRPSESVLIQRLRRPLGEDGHMPPESRAQPPASEIQVIENWIAAQAAASEALPESSPSEQAEAVEDAPATLQLNGAAIPPATSETLAALRNQLVHVEPIERGSNLLSVDFGAVAKSLSDAVARGLLIGVREQVASLSLARMSVSDETMAVIGTLPNLRSVDLRDTGVGDAGIAQLQESVVSELNIAQTRVGDAAVDVLSRMKSLERVYVWKSALSEQAIAKIRAARPDLQIVSGAEADADAVDSETALTYSSDAPTPGTPATPAGLKPVNEKCPVTGSAVDPRYSIVHEGRVIGFCCPNCPREFWSDPKKFANKIE